MDKLTRSIGAYDGGDTQLDKESSNELLGSMYANNFLAIESVPPEILECEKYIKSDDGVRNELTRLIKTNPLSEVVSFLEKIIKKEIGYMYSTYSRIVLLSGSKYLCYTKVSYNKNMVYTIMMEIEL